MRLSVWKGKAVLDDALFEVRQIPSEASQEVAFIRLIAQYEAPLRRLVGAFVEQASDREDLFQEIAVAVWQALPRFRGEASERTWLYRIAHNVAISFTARLRRRSRVEEGIPERFDPTSSARDAEQEVLKAERFRQLQQAIRDLQVTDRQIVLLHLEGLSYSEIEAVSGLSESAIATRLTRIREKLKEKITGRRPAPDER
jgi:RNA polymerase sigma-70 factor (ECF subfamily)